MLAALMQHLPNAIVSGSYIFLVILNDYKGNYGTKQGAFPAKYK